MKLSLMLASVATLAIAAASAQAQAPAGYKVVKEVSLGAPERWDYVVYDAPSQRVYVAHSDRISVVDAQEGKLIGEVTGVSGTHGVGISNGKGYTDDGEAGMAIVFDPKTLKVIKRIPAKPDADGIAVDSKSGHVFIVDGDSKMVTVIDAKTDTVLANIDAGGGLEYAVPGDDGKVYVNGAEKKEIVRIDVKTNAIDARWPMPGCTSAHGLAIDPAAHRLFIAAADIDPKAPVPAGPNGRPGRPRPVAGSLKLLFLDPVR